MNWLIYVPGGFLGVYILIAVIKPSNNTEAFLINLFWILLWIGICWKYI